jgi:hypothetical protein
LFGKVRDDVARATGQQQRPEVYQQLGGEPIFLVRSAPKPSGLELAELTRGEVRAIQQSLAWIGSWDGPVDGAVSAELVAAVRGFQRGRGEEGTGRLGPADVLALHRRAAAQRPPEPLPPSIELTDVVSRSARGDPEGQRLMAMILDPTFAWLGLPKDRAEAVHFYRLAAEQGDAAAAARLGLALSAPGRPEEERAAAREWLEMAARAGESRAALRLAELLLEDRADAAGRSRALELLKVAAASPETDGVANAFLRDAGVPPVAQ